MSKFVFYALAFLALGGFAGTYKLYNVFYNVILEPKYIDNFNVVEILGAHLTSLKISGHPFYSGMIVRTTTEKRDGQTITVLVHLALIGLVKPKTTGIFEYEISVPEAVTEVRFGRSSTLIWKRGASPVHTPNQP